MKASLRKFEGDFHTTEFIDKLARKPLQDQCSSGENPHFNTNTFITSFERALKELDKLSATVDNEISSITKEKETRQVEHKQHMEQLLQHFQETFSKFEAIDKQIYERGSTAIRIGERLEMIERQREKAAEAKTLIERFSQLNQQQQLPAIMTDDKKIHERATLIKKLLSITQDLEAIPNKTEMGKQRVIQCSNDLENRLLQLFDQAQADEDFAKMRECARTLCTFNGGTSVVKRYISQQPIFLNASFWNGEGSLTVETIKDLFSKVKETCRREQEITAKVFPNHSVVMKQLLEKIFLQYIQRLLERSLPHLQGDKGLHEWLRVLELVFDLTKELIQEVSLYNIPEMDYSSILSTLFSDYIEEFGLSKGTTQTNILVRYSHKENQWLASFNKEKLREYQALLQSGSPKTAKKVTKSSQEEEFRSQQMMQLSGEMAIEFINASKEAVGRCTKIVKPENLFVNFGCLSLLMEHRAQVVHSILTTLIRFFGYQYLDSVLEAGFTSLSHESADEKISKYMTLSLELKTKNPSAETNRKISQFLSLVQQVTQSVVLFLEFFQTNIYPHISTEENQKMQCVLEKNGLISCLESKIHPGIEQVIHLVISNVNHILATEQKKNDFYFTDDQMMDGKEYTMACKKTIQYLEEHYKVVKQRLDGRNAQNYLRQLGLYLYQTFLGHVKRQSISLGLGGMMLLRDLSQYKDFVGKFGCDSVSERFAVLRDIANIHIVPSENIQTLIEDSHLAKMDREELMSIIHLRNDFKAGNSQWRNKK